MYNFPWSVSRALRDIRAPDPRNTNISSFGEFGSLGSYKIAVSTKYIMTRTKAHFNGISNPSNQSILFLSISCSSSCQSCPAASLLDPELIFEVFGEFRSFNLLYSVSSWSCQDPGRKIFGGTQPFLRGGTPGRPGASWSSNKKPQKTVFLYRGVWEFDARRPVRARELIPSLSTGYTQ